MNNSLLTQTFTRLKPTKYLASLVLLARLKNSASLSALILATLLLAACGGGGGGSGGGGGNIDRPINAGGVTTDPAGAIRGVFPDDGAVSWTLNITRQNLALPIISLNVTARITEDCSIAQVSPTALTYGTNNQTTTSFDITFTGTATVGGSCNVNFAVNELTDLGTQTRTLRRIVDFSAEQAPTLVASLIDSGTDVSSTESVRVNVTATKQDGSNTPSITFPASVVSSACTATLDGSTARQYNGVIAGTSSVSVTYNVSPLNLAVATNCGSFAFTSTEGLATGMMSPPFLGPISFVIDETDTDGDGVFDFIDNCPMIANPGQSDLDGDDEGDVCDDDIDGDGTSNAVDVDDDGDGLIELSTAAQLNMMRNNLYGSGLDADNSDGNHTTGGNSVGCGGLNGIAACIGYEQMANIDLTAAGYANWEPVGTCGSGTSCGAAGGAQFFTGVFSGNNFIISNLSINIITTSYGIGFFGAIAPNAQVHNVHIRGGNITLTIVTSSNVGGLVGRGDGATISNSSVTLDEISGSENVGGLVGWGNGATISSSVATVGSVSGTSFVGGLIGDGTGATISSSVATVGSISAPSTLVGGLIGTGIRSTTSSSVATVGSISGAAAVGGLVGQAEGAIISFSVAITNSINSSTSVGSLLGFVSGTSVANSYWDDRVVGPDGVTMLADNGAGGSGQTTSALQTPTTFTGIYATWANAYCNPNTGEYRATLPDPIGDFIRVWDLGTASQYPAITCVRGFFPLDVQREASRRALAGELPLVD